jgi:preprotein translocase subunit SecF
MKTTSFNVIGNRRIWYILSTVLILPGIISLAVWHLNVGIDFKGGTLQQISFDSRPAVDDIRSTLAKTNVSGVQVQSSNTNDVLVRFPNETGKVARDEGNTIIAALNDAHYAPREVSFENIGGSVASDTTKSAVTAVILACLAIIGYIAFSFRNIPRPASSWRFAVSTILALLHDILFVIGAFSLIGHFFPNIEVDSLFITALLTILGFSVNDTIVVFDRIRENLRRAKTGSFEEIANASLNQTLVRSLNTTFTVLIVLLSLLLLGGSSIRNFILALTLGVAIGAYSSIFNAAPLLVTWQNWADARTPEPKKRK